MSFNRCMMTLGLNGKIPAKEIREVAKSYEARGMSAEDAFVRAVEDRLELARMDEKRIVKAVREAYESQGGKKRKPRAKAKAEPVREEKAAAAEKPQPAPAETPAQEVSAPAAPIGDFGEKIHGARKDVWASFQHSMQEDLPEDVKDITLAKHWPEPPYDKLIEDGADAKALAAFKALRDAVPAKPRVPYKAKRWGEQVKLLREFATAFIDGRQDVAAVQAKMRESLALRDMADRIDLYAKVGYPNFTRLKDYGFEQHHYTMFRGETPPGGVSKYELSHTGMRSDYFDTVDEAADALKTRLATQEAAGDEGGKDVKLDLYRVTATGDIVIGKKVGAGKFIDLKTGFKDVRSAREYLSAHRAELVELLEKKKNVRPERRSVNDPRVGIDRRQGEDVSPEKFGTTFGFRGVQFGNYVEQKRRAADLNNAYDALLDMADMLGIAPQAISLNGTLGLAFGARGKGGKNPAAAHYEPGQVVINLTKTNGAGSLGHEWWHALDNYFARMRGDTDRYVTQAPSARMKPGADRKLVADTSIRQEALDAFKGVVDSVRNSGMMKRSVDLDKRRTKDYWSTVEEMTARAFESYLIDRAREQGHSNDYLANIVPEEAHEAMNGMTGEDEPFPYPTRTESEKINAAFDKLFATLETREEGGKVALYSVGEDSIASTIDRLMTDKGGEAQVSVPAIGEVTLVYGDAKQGLAHIARRRGEAFMAQLPRLLETGNVYTKPGQNDRIFVGTDAHEAVIRLTRDGQDKTWLLSAYEKYPDLQQMPAARSQAQRRSGDVLDKAGLEQALTGEVVLGEMVRKMIASGLVVLHDSPKQLPSGVGRNVRGVQAVTMPDGTVHMVASNLTRENAQAVMLHEAFHSGAEKLLGTQKWADMMGRLGSLYRQAEQSNGRAREFFDRARARVADAKAKGAVAARMEVEEFAAYAIEEYETSPQSVPAALRKWIEDLIGLVKAFVQQKYGKQLGQVTPAQLAALARVAVADVVARNQERVFGRQVAPMFSAGEEPTVQVDGVRRPIYNSNGQLVAEDMGKQMAFWRWFKDSAVVDEQGRPIAMYHGTDAGDITEFHPATYFSEDAQDAGGYTEGGAVYPTYIAIEHPYEANDEVDEENRSELTQIDPEYARVLAAQGYDGVVARRNGQTLWAIPFKPEQVKSATGNAGTFYGTNPDIRYSVASESAAAEQDTAEPEGLTPPEQGLWRRLQASLQDGLNRVRQVQDKIEETTGAKLTEKADYYGAEINRPGRIAARLEDAEKQLFAPLMEKLAASGHTREQLSELLHAMHAKERNEAIAKINPKMPDGGSGMTNAKADEVLAKYEGNDALHALADEARAVARATLDMKLAYGLITPETHQTLSGMYEHYVPLKGAGEFGPKIKRAMGHEAREEHILENIARDYDQAVVVGEKNLARQFLLRMVLQNPDPDLWTVGVPPKGRYVAGKVYEVKKGSDTVATFDSQAEVRGFLEAQGPGAVNFHVVDSAGEQVVEFTKPLQDNEVMVYVKGDGIRIQLHDEALARQIRPLDAARLHPILEFMRGMNRYLSKIYTGYNPAFILRNATRDAMTGTINMVGHQGAATAAKAWAKYPMAVKTLGQWAATGKVPAGEFGKMLLEYRLHGGKVGASYMSDLEQQGKTLERLFDDAYGARAYARDGKPTKAALIAGRKVVGGLAHVVEVANQATENALRLALYMQLREQGASPAKAAQAAKTVTVDFDRKGTMTPALGAIYLFFNPAVQGTANALKTLAKGEHRAQALMALGMLAALGFAAAAAGMDDDRDRWLGEGWETRSKNLILSAGGRQFRMPLSQEFSPAYAFGAALAEASRGEKAMTSSVRVLSSFLDAYFPMNGAFQPESDNHPLDLGLAMTPTVLKTGMQIATNRNQFGSQIVPDTELTKDRPDNLKMFRGTKGTPYDAAAQGIASIGEMTGAGKYENDITKVSPETLKLLWRTYTGGLGQFITDSAGTAAMATQGDAQLTDIPVVKDFVHEKDVKPIRARYYDLSRDAHAAITEFEQIKKAGDGEALDKMLADPAKANVIGMGNLVKHVNKAVGAIRDAEADVNAREDMTAGQKRAALKDLEQQEEALYREAIGALR